MKYIDAEKLTKAIEDKGLDCSFALKMERLDTLALIDELQQEQPNDVRAEIKEYYGEDLAFEDERTKAAYHFFSAGKAFELREYEEEREKHMTDLLNNFQKGMNAGYEKAISELKEGKVECSPVMKELIDKLFGIGNTFNFGFGPKNIQQEQPSLPDNLDEAARRYAIPAYMKDVDENYLDEYPYDPISENAFKAGAEWMAGQGYTVDGIVICDKDLTRGYKDIVMSIPDELKVDDKVTIQIRKRE